MRERKNGGLTVLVGCSEEDRLKVAKTLVDMQIENSRVVENAEAREFEQVGWGG